MDITKCPSHPNSCGESQYGGMWCWGNDKACKWAVKEFVNDTPDGGVEKVTKYHLPQPGKWLTKEDYISTQTAGDFPPDESGNFGPHLAESPDAPQSPSEEPGQTLWAKDRLRARTDCIACATGIFKSSLEAGILKEFPSAAAVVAYAVDLEKWAKDGT